LINHGLIAFDGRQFQVLVLPPSVRRPTSSNPFQQTVESIRNPQGFSQ
jgi:hypothetical protein